MSNEYSYSLFFDWLRIYLHVLEGLLLLAVDFSDLAKRVINIVNTGLAILILRLNRCHHILQ